MLNRPLDLLSLLLKIDYIIIYIIAKNVDDFI